MNNLIVLALLCFMLFMLYKNRDTIENFRGCLGDCKKFSLRKCEGCNNCVTCTDKKGYKWCVRGDAQGPTNPNEKTRDGKLKCDTWRHGPEYGYPNYYGTYDPYYYGHYDPYYGNRWGWWRRRHGWGRRHRGWGRRYSRGWGRRIRNRVSGGRGGRGGWRGGRR